MSIALANRVSHLEQRLDRLEDALNILLKAEPTHVPSVDDAPAVIQLQNEIRAMKARMGRVHIRQEGVGPDGLLQASP